MGPELLVLVIIAAVIGGCVGTFTGLVPGIHVNTVAAVLVASYPFLEGALSGAVSSGSVPLLISCCIFSASTVHSFVDFVPSVFTGAPDPDEAVSVLPGHRLLSEGRGMAAVRAAAAGSAVGACSALLLALPLQWLMLNGAETVVESLTVGILALSIIILVATSSDILMGALLLLASGFAGFAVQYAGIPSAGLTGEGTLLFPMLTGLFGAPTLIAASEKKRKVRQRDDGRCPVDAVPGLKGVATGLIAGWYPGITSTVGATLASAFGRERTPERFIATVASIGTVTAVFSVVTLAVSGSGRSGTAQAVKDIIGDSLQGFASEAFVAILFSIAFASAIGYAATIASGKCMMRIYDSVPEDMLNSAILALITVLVFLFTGPMGLAVLVCCTALGMVPPAVGVSRIPLTGCLLIPALLSQLGLAEGIAASLGWPL